MATKTALITEVNTNYPDNTAGAITPALLRTTATDGINSWQQAPAVSVQSSGTSYTITVNDYGQAILIGVTTAFTVTLPAATSTGFFPFNVLVKNAGTGVTTVSPASGTVDGAASVTLNPNQSAWLISNGVNWDSGIITAGSSVALVAGSTTVTGGVSGNYFYNNAGVFTERTAAQVTGTLSLFNASSQGVVPSPGVSTTTFLRADGAWATPTGTGGNVNGPATSVVGHFASWNNLTGSLLADLSPAAATAALTLFSSSAQGVVGASGGGTVNFLRADGSWAAPAGGVTGPGSSTVGHFATWNNTAGTLLADTTPAAVAAALPLFSASAQGLVAASGGGTVNFLRADGSWIAPAGTGNVTGPATSTVGHVATFNNATGTLLADLANTGTGNNVLATSPTLVTPTLGVATATSINGVTITTVAASTLSIANGKTLTVNNSLSLLGTDGTTMTFPATNGTVAALNIADQTVTGGANVNALSLTAGSFTVDCGLRPLQFITNNGAFSITAPGNDGSTIILVTNGAAAGAISFPGFSFGANTGDPLTTTSGSHFSIFIWRINGISGYRVAAHQ